MKKVDNCNSNNILLVVEKCWFKDLTVTFVTRILTPIDRIEVRVLKAKTNFYFLFVLNSAPPIKLDIMLKKRYNSIFR